MMADLEERAGENTDSVHDWLLRASTAPPDPAWVCGDCGAAWETWSPVCGACDALGTLDWEQPARARTAGLPGPDNTDGADEETLLLDDELPEPANSAGSADADKNTEPRVIDGDAVRIEPVKGGADTVKNS